MPRDGEEWLGWMIRTRRCHCWHKEFFNPSIGFLSPMRFLSQFTLIHYGRDGTGCLCVCVCSLCYVCKCAHVFLCVVCVVYVCACVCVVYVLVHVCLQRRRRYHSGCNSRVKKQRKRSEWTMRLKAKKRGEKYFSPTYPSPVTGHKCWCGSVWLSPLLFTLLQCK